jgi:hypothetical protein
MAEKKISHHFPLLKHVILAIYPFGIGIENP